jgi:hypothetical protein
VSVIRPGDLVVRCLSMSVKNPVKVYYGVYLGEDAEQHRVVLLPNGALKREFIASFNILSHVPRRRGSHVVKNGRRLG